MLPLVDDLYRESVEVWDPEAESDFSVGAPAEHLAHCVLVGEVRGEGLPLLHVGHEHKYLLPSPGEANLRIMLKRPRGVLFKSFYYYYSR